MLLYFNMFACGINIAIAIRDMADGNYGWCAISWTVAAVNAAAVIPSA